MLFFSGLRDPISFPTASHTMDSPKHALAEFAGQIMARNEELLKRPLTLGDGSINQFSPDQDAVCTMYNLFSKGLSKETWNTFRLLSQGEGFQALCVHGDPRRGMMTKIDPNLFYQVYYVMIKSKKNTRMLLASKKFLNPSKQSCL